jgi:hypothetical protein
MSSHCCDLIECKSCKKQISPLAQSCPGCGAPNEWVHAGVQRFLDNVSSIQPAGGLTYWHDKVSVWGETGKMHTAVSIVITLVTVVVAAPLALFAFWFAFFIGFVGFFLAGHSKRKETFRADFSTGAWESSSNDFWKPLREMLAGDLSPEQTK